MVRQYDILRALALIFVVLLVAMTAESQVPTSADVAACNEEAPKAVKAGTASPTTDDRARPITCAPTPRRPSSMAVARPSSRPILRSTE